MSSVNRGLAAGIVFAGLLFTGAPGHGQTAAFNDWTAAASDWMNSSNWSLNAVPDLALNSDIVRITNDGHASLAAAAPTIGGLILGNANGQSGQLSIQAGGSLTAATDPGFPLANGQVVVGQAASGLGTLLVPRGASLTAVGLSSGGSATSTVTLGSVAGAGSATVSVQNATLNRTTRVIGPNVNFTASDTLEFTGPSNLIAQITSAAVAGGAGHSALKANTVAMGGTLTVEFGAGISANAGNAWNLFDARNVAGVFANVNTALAPDIGLGQVYAVRTQPGGVNGQLVQLAVEQRLVLNVDRNTQAVSISNPGGAAVAIDGYTISSPTLGALNQANWTPIGGSWQVANSSANRLSQLAQSGSLNLAPATVQPLGAIFSPAATAFDAYAEDLVFEYTQPDGATRTGVVNFTGAGGINDLSLLVNPATGEAQLRNTSSTTVAIDAYTISSTFGALDASQWNSLDDQNAAGGDWQEANISPNRISELKFDNATTLAGGQSLALGSPFKEVGGKKDLVFQYILDGEEATRTGFVVYGAISAPTIPGDFNGNGVVNGADLTQWRSDFGPSAGSDSDGDGDSDGSDFLVWQRNVGQGASAVAISPIPEGSTGAMTAAALVSCAVHQSFARRRKTH